MAKKDSFKEFAETIENSGSVGEQHPSTDNVQTSPRRSSKNTKAPQEKKPSSEPSANDNYVQKTFYMREDLCDAVSIIATRTKRSFKEIMNELVQGFVDKNRELL